MHTLRLLGATTFGAFIFMAAPPLGLLPSAGLLPSLDAAYAQDALRPAVGTPLERAKGLMAAHNYSAASAQVNVADKQKNKTAYENFVIQEMRGAIAQSSGDTATASRIFQDLINSGRIGGAQLTNMLLAQTSLAYQMKDYPGVINWAQRYTKSGGKDPAVRTLIIQAYYLQKDYANAAKAQQDEIDAEIKAKKVPSEDQLQLLAACQKAIPDNAGLETTMVQLITYYPKQSYWADVIYSLQVKPGLSDRLALDIARLRILTGTMSRENDYMEMSELAMGENDPGGAAIIMREARAAKVFGPGAGQAREDRLQLLVDKTASDTKAKMDATLASVRSSPASTSQQLYDVGGQYASFGQFDKGIGLMKEALDKGGLRRPEMAQLRMAETMVYAGDKPGAVAAFQAVPQTGDGISDVATLWLLWLKTQPTLVRKSI